MLVEIDNDAKKKIDQILEKKDPKELLEKRLRIYVSGHGWGGTTLGLVLEEPEESDFILDANGYRFAIADGLETLYKKFMIMFLESSYRSKFVVLARENLDDQW